MPVLHVRGDVDHVPRQQRPGILAPLLVPAASVGDEQDLAAALGGVMDVPVVTAAGLEGDIGDELGLRGVGQRIEVRAPREVLRIGVVGGAQAEQTAVCLRVLGAERIAAGGLDYYWS